MANTTPFFYRFTRGFFYLLFKIGWRLKIEGQNHIPKTGAFIVACNHRSLADPPLLGVGLKREINFLAKKELFKSKIFSWIITNLHAHPLDRANSLSALRKARALLEAGHPVALFPEGTRQSSDQLGPVKMGVGLLSLKTQSPVLPTYIHNSGHLLKGRRLHIKFGSVLDPKDFQDYRALSQAVIDAIRKLQQTLPT